jgi:hypothetical protein
MKYLFYKLFLPCIIIFENLKAFHHFGSVCEIVLLRSSLFWIRRSKQWKDLISYMNRRNMLQLEIWKWTYHFVLVYNLQVICDWLICFGFSILMTTRVSKAPRRDRVYNIICFQFKYADNYAWRLEKMKFTNQGGFRIFWEKSFRSDSCSSTHSDWRNELNICTRMLSSLLLCRHISTTTRKSRFEIVNRKLNH